MFNHELYKTDYGFKDYSLERLVHKGPESKVYRIIINIMKS